MPLNGSYATAEAKAAPQYVREATEKVPAKASQIRTKPGFRHFAQIGLGSRAVIYALLAYLDADVALTRRAPAQPSGSGALAEIGKQPAGGALLAVLAVGLACYACWRVVQVLSQKGDENQAKSTFERVAWAAAALVYVGLCAQAVALAVGSGGGGGGTTSRPQPFVAYVLRWPAGPLWVGLVGAGLAIGGLGLAVWGFVHDYGHALDTNRVRGVAFQVARATGMAGDAARGLLVLLVSVYLLEAAATNDPSRAKGAGQALSSFDRLQAGPALLLIAAFGLACFAVYSVFEALYRRV
ncbi:MAG TPA: DUF1206 domain-containing protein [Acidimicrobiales bacterium]|nr:DUF1206 domain-containing protein [Acidimicrobiales bacterium]